MSDEDVFFCAVCETHFNSSDTLAKHRAAFHEPKPSAAPAPASVEPPNMEDGSNLEIAPLLTVCRT
jgi:hypothetical protein